MPGFLEVAPDEYRNIDDCTADELATAGQSRLMQARTLMDNSARLLELAEQRRRQVDT